MKITIFAAMLTLVLSNSAQAFDPPGSWLDQWPDTDFATASVDLAEVESGGPPKDGIPAIDSPTFHPVSKEADLTATEPVVSFAYGGDARAYPIRYLMWHEIVNDKVGGKPVAVTYCPLCNSAIVFDSRLNGRELTFGVSGMLRNSDMIMYDRQTESWWQQFTGESVVGELVGSELKSLPARLESWDSFRERFPDGKVMQQPSGYDRRYGANPYVGYDSLTKPWLYSGEPPSSGLPMMARIIRVGERAWPMARVVDKGSLAEAGLMLRWQKGQSSALDGRSVGGGRDVGNVEVLDANGALVPHEVTFAFVFQAFHPDGTWMMGE
jgi:hypothetical protein